MNVTHAFVELVLLAQNGSTLNLQAPQVTHTMSNIEEDTFPSADLSTNRTNNIYVASRQFVDTQLRPLFATGTPKVKVRIGLGNNSWLPWQDHIITLFKADIRESGYLVQIQTTDRLVEFNRTSATLSHRGRISDIVNRLASQAGLDTIIEPTTGYDADLYLQINMGWPEFVAYRLAPRALNKSGQGAYRFYIQDNLLHFHTSNFVGNIKQVVYSGPSRATSFVIHDRSQHQVKSGAVGVTIVSVDPLTGSLQILQDDQNKSLKLADALPILTNVPSGDLVMWHHVSQNTFQEAAAMAQSIYDSSRLGIYEATLMSSAMLVARPNDFVQMVLNNEQLPQAWSGLWSVHGVRHLIDTGSFTSNLLLSRGELTLPGTVSPGVSLNVANLQTSQKLNTTGPNQDGSITVPVIV